MRIRYTVTNTGTLTVKGIDIVDEVTTLEGADAAAKQALTDALNTALKAEGRGFTLRPNESKTVEISVDAPLTGHVNVAKVTAPAVTTLPGSTIPGTTVPGTEKNGTTIPGTTAPEITVPPKTVTPNTPSNTAQATPTTSLPPVQDPQFVVEKFRAQAGNINLERNAEGKYAYSAEYVIRVRNSGAVDGTHAQIWDAPVRGVGFTVDTVTVDGTEINPQSGRYLVADATELKANQYRDYRVVVSGTVTDEAANALPAAVGQCEAVTPENPGAGSGLVNQVAMNGDSDGPANNIVCAPVELRRLNIEKRIDGRDNAPVTPGQPMEIWYRVRNSGNVTLQGITLADKIREDNAELQQQIDEAVAKIGAFDLAPGELRDIRFQVTVPEGEHTNEVIAQVPPTTVPPVTVPATTIPGTTGPSTTVPPVTIPGTTLPGTSVPPTTVTDTARAGSPKLEVKKFINGRDEHALVNAGEDMAITYRVSNTGSARIDGIRLTDQVKEDNADLQRAIDAQLGKVAPFSLAPGDSYEVTVTVKAPAGRHDNTVNVTVPPVTIPATTIPGTTNPSTTVPPVTVPSTVVTVTAPPDDAASDSVELAILKEIRGTDGAWRDAETAQDAAPMKADGTMDLRYTVTNTGSVALSGVDIVDEVTELDGATDEEKQALTTELNEALKAEGQGLALKPGESKTVEITVEAPKGAHVNVAKATAPAVTTVETVVSSIPGTTNETTTVPGSLTTQTTTVEVTPNTPTNKAQSTPTTDPSVPPVTTTVPKTVVTTVPCDCEPTTVTEVPDPVTSLVTSEITTVVTETQEPVTKTETTPVTTVITETPEPVTKTQTTPVTTVVTQTPEPVTETLTPESQTVTVTTEVVTTAPGETYTIVIVDDNGNPLTTLPGSPGAGTITQTRPEPQTVVQTTTVTDIPDVDKGTIEKCVANAIRSPFLYMVPLVLAGQVLGEFAAPYLAMLNDQFSQISAEINGELRRRTPDFGHGRRGRDDDQFAEFRARIDAANRELQRIANDPEVRKYGEWAAIAAGLVVAGAVIYDWCTHEAGEAYTSIGAKSGSSVDGEGGLTTVEGTVTTVIAPVTRTGSSS